MHGWATLGYMTRAGFFSFSLQVREVGGLAINAPRGFSQIWLQVREKSVFKYLKPQSIYIYI